MTDVTTGPKLRGEISVCSIVCNNSVICFTGMFVSFIKRWTQASFLFVTFTKPFVFLQLFVLAEQITSSVIGAGSFSCTQIYSLLRTYSSKYHPVIHLVLLINKSYTNEFCRQKWLQMLRVSVCQQRQTTQQQFSVELYTRCMFVLF